jgi:hypothetical protein
VCSRSRPLHAAVANFFLQQSLAAGRDNQHALTVKTAGSVNPTDLDPYRVVIVNDASGMNESRFRPQDIR